MNTNFIQKIALGSVAVMILASCESHEQNENDTFKYVKENGKDAKDSIATTLAKPIKEAEKIRVVYKNIMMDEWAIYKVEIENRIKTGDVKIQELKFRKDFPENKNKFNRQITRLEKRNNDLRKKMDNYHEEVKAKWEKFKVSMANDIDGVAIELKDVTLDNKKKDK